MNLTRFLPVSVLTIATSAILAAAPLSFDFKDPKGVNAAQFKLDAPLEAISGSGNGISGTVSFDPAKPAATTGSLTLATASLTVTNDTMSGHMHSAGWLDTDAFPEITFVAKSLANVVTTGATTKATVTGDLTIKGVTKSVSAPITLTYLPGKLGERVPKMNGDLLVLRTTFEINRSEFGIKPGQMTDKVAENISLSLALAGAATK